MSQVKCLTCKYAPEWSLPTGVFEPRSTGPCQKSIDMPSIPATYVIQQRWAEVYADGSGFPYNCKAWEQKTCRDDGRCQYAIDHGAEGLGHCPKGKCVMPENKS